MDHLSDRARIELIAIPALMAAVVTAMQKAAPFAALDTAAQHLKLAMREPIDEQMNREKLLRRAMRLTQGVLSPIFEAPLGAQYLAVALFTRRVVETGYLSIGAESPFMAAWDALADTFSTLLDHSEIVVTAERLAEKLEANFKVQGYFMGLV
jgi:hypothetical protein